MRVFSYSDVCLYIFYLLFYIHRVLTSQKKKQCACYPYDIKQILQCVISYLSILIFDINVAEYVALQLRLPIYLKVSKRGNGTPMDR